MKRKSAVLLFVILFFLTSCSSLSSRVQSAVSGYPFWYYEQSVGLDENEKSFVAVGQATEERQAELLAYSNLSEALSEYLGHEISQEEYREMVTLGTIDSYALKIENKECVLKNGNYIYLLRLKGDFDYLQSFRTRSAVERETRSERIKDLVLEGDSYIKNNQDLKGVSSYLKSMVLSFGFDGLDEQYSFDEIKDEVLEILNSISIVVESSNPSNVSAVIGVKRKESIIASAVEDCNVKAQYVSVDGKGNVYSDFERYTTGHNGKLGFNLINNAVQKKGRVKFSFDLEEEIKALSEVSASDAGVIEKTADSKSVYFEYNREYFFGKIGICASEYDIDANFRRSNRLSEKLCSMLAYDGVESIIVNNSNDVTDEVLSQRAFSDAYQAGCFLSLRTGVVSFRNSDTGMCSVSVEGKMAFYDKSGNTVYESEIISANGFGTDYSDAEEHAFENMCRIAYTLLKAIYV